MPFGRRGFSLRSLVLYIFIIFGLLAVFGLFFLPLWKLAEVAFQEEGQLSLGIFWGLLTDPKTLKVIWDTIYINILSSFFATVIGVIMAYFVAYADIRGKKFIHYALLLPLVIPGYIITLAWMCPFLYTNSWLLGILNGLGKTNMSFAINVTGLLLRIGSVFLLIPVFGIQGYLWGLLASQMAVFALCLAYLRFFFFTL